MTDISDVNIVFSDLFELEAMHIANIINQRNDYIYNLNGDKYINIEYTCKKCKTFSCLHDDDFRVHLPALIREKTDKKIKDVIILPETVLCNWRSCGKFCWFNLKCLCVPLLCCFLPMLPYMMIKKRRHRLYIVVLFQR